MLDSHLQQSEKQSKEIEYPCEKCNFTYNSRTGYEKHLQGIQHNTVVRDDSFSVEEDDDEEQIEEQAVAEVVPSSRLV